MDESPPAVQMILFFCHELGDDQLIYLLSFDVANHGRLNKVKWRWGVAWIGQRGCSGECRGASVVLEAGQYCRYLLVIRGAI